MNRLLAEVNKMMGKRAVHLCPFCSKDISEEVFRDILSAREAKITGLCQKCQDDLYKKGGEE